MSMRWMYILLAVFSVLMASFAQMLLKKGATIEHASFVREYLNGWVIGGYFIMGVSMLVNIFAMSRGVQLKELSVIESFGYLFVPLLSWVFFKEKVTWRKVGAIMMIMAGVVLFFCKCC